jgi:hypothetical protein
VRSLTPVSRASVSTLGHAFSPSRLAQAAIEMSTSRALPRDRE